MDGSLLFSRSAGRLSRIKRQCFFSYAWILLFSVRIYHRHVLNIYRAMQYLSSVPVYHITCVCFTVGWAGWLYWYHQVLQVSDINAYSELRSGELTSERLQQRFRLGHCTVTLCVSAFQLAHDRCTNMHRLVRRWLPFTNTSSSRPACQTIIQYCECMRTVDWTRINECLTFSVTVHV